MLKTLDRLSEMLEALSVSTVILAQQRQVGHKHPRHKSREYTSLASQVTVTMVSNSSSLTYKASLTKEASYSLLEGRCVHWSVSEELAIYENDLISQVSAEP